MTDRRSPMQRRLRRSDLSLGVGIVAFGLLFALMWAQPPAGPGRGERAFLLFPAVGLVAFGLGFVVSGVSTTLGLPGRRYWQLAPLVVTPLVIVLAFAWLVY